MREQRLRSVVALLLCFPQASAFGPSDLPSRERCCGAADHHHLSSSSSALGAHLTSTNRRNHAADNSLTSSAVARTLIDNDEALRISKVSPPHLSCRRIAKGLSTLAAVLSILSVLTGFSCFNAPPPPASAAPPIAVIAEELGFFPVQSRDGTVTYIPKRVQRESTPQAVQLADHLRANRVVLFGTYWCPHTSRQKELLGREAFARLDYVECAPKGYQGNPKLCIENRVDGYPTWIVVNGREGAASPATKELAGERSLAEIAEFAGYSGRFSDELEQANPPPPIGGSACKQKTMQ